MRRLAAFTALWQAVRGQAAGEPGLGVLLQAVPRMAVAVATGTYTGVDVRRLVPMAAALAYVVSPVDAVPEALFLLVGLGDDAVVLSWLAGALLAEARAFVEWESTVARTGPGASGRVVRGDVVG